MEVVDMKIILPKGKAKDAVYDAISKANEHLHGNLTIKRFDVGNVHRDGRLPIDVTLTVHDSKEIGSRRAPRDGKRIAAACWHAHGLFFDALPEGTEIRTMAGVSHAGDSWADYNIGSQAYPCMASDACNCMEGGELPFPVND
jgi:hypothetical protein